MGKGQLIQMTKKLVFSLISNVLILLVQLLMFLPSPQHRGSEYKFTFAAMLTALWCCMWTQQCIKLNASTPEC